MATGKRRKRKMRFVAKLFVLFICTMMLYVFSSTFLKSYNVSLNARKQKALNEIADLKYENELARLDIESLTEYNRIMSIVGTDSISINSTSIVNLANNNE